MNKEKVYPPLPPTKKKKKKKKKKNYYLYAHNYSSQTNGPKMTLSRTKRNATRPTAEIVCVFWQFYIKS